MVRVVVLGAGLSGLIHGYFIKKQNPQLELTILDKSSRPGGHIQTLTRDGFIFELGPFGFGPKGTGSMTLDLARELGLWDQVILSQALARPAHIYLNGKLLKVPSNPWQALTSPLTRGLFSALWHDLTSEPVMPWDVVEETARSFFRRHFGQAITDNLIDPWLSFERLGDMDKLSIQAAYPDLADFESTFGSLIKAYLKRQAAPVGGFDYPKHVLQSSYFSFKNGLSTLTLTLAKRLQSHLMLESELLTLQRIDNVQRLTLSSGRTLEADLVISTLPAYALAAVLPQAAEVLKAELRQIEYAPLATVCLGYSQKLNLQKAGSGYLVPHTQKQGILGTCFHSQIFPEHAPADCQSLTVYIGGAKNPLFSSFNENHFVHLAIEKIKDHLRIDEHPQLRFCKIIPQALPQFNVGHLERLKKIRAHTPLGMYISGNFIKHFTPDAVLSAAKQLTLEIPQFQADFAVAK